MSVDLKAFNTIADEYRTLDGIAQQRLYDVVGLYVNADTDTIDRQNEFRAIVNCITALLDTKDPAPENLHGAIGRLFGVGL